MAALGNSNQMYVGDELYNITTTGITRVPDPQESSAINSVADNEPMSAKDFMFKTVDLGPDPITGQKRYQKIVIAPDGTMRKSPPTTSRAGDSATITMYQMLAEANNQPYTIRTNYGSELTTIRPDGTYETIRGNEDGSAYGQSFNSDGKSLAPRTLGYVDAEGSFVEGRPVSRNAQAQNTSAASGTTSAQPVTSAQPAPSEKPATREDLVARVQGLKAQVAQLQANRQEMQSGVDVGTNSGTSWADYLMAPRPTLSSNSDNDEENEQSVTRNLVDKRTQSTMSPGKLYDAWRMSRRDGFFT